MTSYDLSTNDLRALGRDFAAQMSAGRSAQKSALKMIRTFASPPSGKETGSVLTVDWGGTNLRVYKVSLKGDGVIEEDDGLTTELRWTDEHRSLPADKLFGLVADQIAALIKKDGGKDYRLGFIFSFPAKQSSLASAVLVAWTKDFKNPGVEGKDVALLLQQALDARGLPVKVTAVANDTVGTQYTAAYQLNGGRPLTDSLGRSVPRDARVSIGLIVGTGYNKSVLWDGETLNMESGNFDGGRPYWTPADQALDRQTTDPAPGAQILEKMVSGKYLGELLRRELRAEGDFKSWKLHAPGDPSASLDEPYSMDSRFLSQAAGADSADALEAVLKKDWGVSASTPAQRSFVWNTARAIARRSARLIAATTASALNAVDPGIAHPHVVAVDGSVWEKTPGYQPLVREALVDLLGSAVADRIHYVQTPGGTALGGALIAAAAPI